MRVGGKRKRGERGGEGGWVERGEEWGGWREGGGGKGERRR